MKFLPQADDTLRLDLNVVELAFRFLPHPDPRLSPARVPHSMSGEKSNIWRIQENVPGGGEYALKVMNTKYRDPTLPDICNYLYTLRSTDGLGCCDRICLTREKCRTVETYPDLEFSVLMPWVKGTSWFDAHQNHNSTRKLSKWETLQLGRRLAEVLAGMEKKSLAHCSLSPENLIVHTGTGNFSVQLVGLENLYSPELPDRGEHGTAVGGYQHPSHLDPGRSSAADRFPGGLLIAEILGWHEARVQEGLYSVECYFAPEELQTPNSERYRLLESAVSEHHKDLAVLLRRVWESRTESDCPPLSEWAEKLQRIARTKIAYAWLAEREYGVVESGKQRCWERHNLPRWLDLQSSGDAPVSGTQRSAS